MNFKKKDDWNQGLRRSERLRKHKRVRDKLCQSNQKSVLLVDQKICHAVIINSDLYKNKLTLRRATQGVLKPQHHNNIIIADYESVT